jgi:hypothetical protein
VVAAERTPFYSIEDLAAASRYVSAVLASGLLGPHERAHMIEVKGRIQEAVQRKKQEEPSPLRGSADVPTA